MCHLMNSSLSFELLAYIEIVLCWIPSHIGIQGNETVDKQAKTWLSLEPTSSKIPFSDFKPSINKYILEEWPENGKVMDLKSVTESPVAN